MTKVYITKYALTYGVFTVEGELVADGTAVSYKRDAGYFQEYAHGKDFQLTEEDALARAEEMRIAKLKSLDKQMKKVSAIKFQIKE